MRIRFTPSEFVCALKWDGTPRDRGLALDGVCVPPSWARMWPGENGGYWYRVFMTRDEVLPVSRRLKLSGVAYVCDKVDRPIPVKPNHPRNYMPRSSCSSRLTASPKNPKTRRHT